MEYTQGICQDGAVILVNGEPLTINGEPLTIEEILERLRSANAVNHDAGASDLVIGLIKMKELMLRNAELMKSMMPDLGHHVELAGAAHITQTWIDGIKEDYASEKPVS